MAYIDAAEAPARHTDEIKLHGPEAFAGMRKAGRLAAECLDMLAPHVVPGVTTGALDDLAREFVLERGALPACVFYKGYRHTVCTSINEVVCHGIPSPERVLKNGDMVNIDVTVIVDGWHGDTSRMFSAGEVPRRSMRLMDVTYECMMRGIEAIKPGARLYDIAAAIQDHAERERYSVVEAFCGHGLGRVFHDAPNILHFNESRAERRAPRDQRAQDASIQNTQLRPGMLFTVEPMINLGRNDVVLMKDGWTAKTRDRSLSAQYEHSIGVTETGFEIFTLSPAGLATPHTSGVGT
ncbi:MAG TPA: type I methionyl aminopeptidase [Hyphomonadaceae bacterium]|jgi:methionyl aminopeptidase|nr:type I methionyl aminopeptidase [Hyphomonadaceae bacterium]